MISATATVRCAAIRWHYDLGSLFYRLLWGEHIHHGVWDRDRLPHDAQRALIARLLRGVPLGAEARVLDVGCGLGGTALYLARHFGCHVTGITLSPVQCSWAGLAARWRGLSHRARFRTENAEEVWFDDASFDLVLSIECTEHLFGKQAFFRRVARWLAPGGHLAICAWLATTTAERDPERRRLVERVCDAFLCPSLATAEEYRDWMTAAGLKVRRVELLGHQVARTWELCLQRTSGWPARWLARLAGKEFVAFLDGFPVILEAYRRGAMEYGLFLAEASGS